MSQRQEQDDAADEDIADEDIDLHEEIGDDEILDATDQVDLFTDEDGRNQRKRGKRDVQPVQPTKQPKKDEKKKPGKKNPPRRITKRGNKKFEVNITNYKEMTFTFK